MVEHKEDSLLNSTGSSEGVPVGAKTPEKEQADPTAGLRIMIAYTREVLPSCQEPGSSLDQLTELIHQTYQGQENEATIATLALCSALLWTCPNITREVPLCGPTHTGLSDRDLTIMTHRLGHTGAKIMTQEELAKQLGVTVGRIGQLEVSARRKMAFFLRRPVNTCHGPERWPDLLELTAQQILEKRRVASGET